MSLSRVVCLVQLRNQVPFEVITCSNLFCLALTLKGALGTIKSFVWKYGSNLEQQWKRKTRGSLAGVTNNHSHKQQQQLWIIVVSQRHRRSTPFSTAKHEHKTTEIHFKLILQSYFNWIYDGKYAMAIYLPWKPSSGLVTFRLEEQLKQC